MEKNLQDKIREKVAEKYRERAWDCLLNYDYWGEKHQAIERQADEYEDRAKHFEGVIAELDARPDHSSVANRNARKAAKKDADAYRNRVASLEPLGKKLMDQAVKWQQQGVEYLELADKAETFKLRTPEEIEASKKAEAPAGPKS